MLMKEFKFCYFYFHYFQTGLFFFCNVVIFTSLLTKIVCHIDPPSYSSSHVARHLARHSFFFEGIFRQLFSHLCISSTTTDFFWHWYTQIIYFPAAPNRYCKTEDQWKYILMYLQVYVFGLTILGLSLENSFRNEK